MEENRTEIKTSVRSLVEFMLRSGDIDNTTGVSSVNAMLEGSRIHRMIQKRMGDLYRAEVPLSYSEEASGYTLTVQGRADGIFTGEDKEAEDDGQLSFDTTTMSFDAFIKEDDISALPMIDEIKGTYRDVKKMEEPDPVHLAQAKCYAYMYAVKEGHKRVRVRMTYCNIRTEELAYFRYVYSFEEIESWFKELIGGYRKWTDHFHEHSVKRDASIKACEFPYTYRKGQRDLAVAVYGTILKGKKLYLNAPTGSGKTIATLFPSVKAVGERKAEKIFYLTAKTTQRLMAEEALEVMRKTSGLVFKSVTLTAKEKICFMDKADCRPGSCPYAAGHYDRVNDALFSLITTADAFDRKTIEEHAEKNMVCPFEFTLDLTLFADGVIGDYNYLFDPFAYLRRFFADGNEGKYLFLADEAHNLPERGRDMYTVLISGREQARAYAACRGVKELKEIRKHLGKAGGVLDHMETKHGDFAMTGRHSELTEALQGFVGAVAAFSDDHPGHELKEEVRQFFFEASRFLTIDDMAGKESRFFVEKTQEDGFSAWIRCMDPSAYLRASMDKGVASVLFSATLSPIHYYKRLLGGTEEDFVIEAPSVFDDSRCARLIVKDVTSRYKLRDGAMYVKIARVIRDTAFSRKGRYLVFFPSYAFMEDVKEAYIAMYGDEDAELLVQRTSMNEEERAAFIGRFNAGIDSSFALSDVINCEIETGEEIPLIGFGIMGGIFSEGIDLKLDALIGVMVVGCGIPQVGREREMLKDYFDEAGLNGFDFAYRFPGMNKVLQAAGRVIRTEEDLGVVVLMDERFMQEGYRRLFPLVWNAPERVLTDEVNARLLDFWSKWEKMDKL